MFPENQRQKKIVREDRRGESDTIADHQHHFVFKFTQRNPINRVNYFITDFHDSNWVG